MRIGVSFTVNGTPRTIETWPLARALDVLRALGLSGTKEGCGEGECGACTVILNGQVVNSCLLPAIQLEGAELTTIEGIEKTESGRKVQDAFVRHGGAQCGFCTPGMIVAATNLLDRKPEPAESEIREALAGNLCRCTGYTRIVESVGAAANGDLR